MVCKYFLSSCRLCLHSIESSLLCRSLLVLCNPICLFLLLFPILWGLVQKKSLPIPMCWGVAAVFSSSSFIVCGLKFKSLTHFKLSFATGKWYGSRFILSGYLLFQHCLLKGLSFFWFMFLAPLSKIRWQEMEWEWLLDYSVGLFSYQFHTVWIITYL